jgi:hypothetical protein
MTTSRGENLPNVSAVEGEVRHLIRRYGFQKTKDALDRQTHRKPGTKLKEDWKILEPLLKADARSWLEGGDPFNERSDYSIAKWFAEKHPDQNVEFDSTLRRIKRRLSKDRRYHALVEAFWLSEAYSYEIQLRVLSELCSLARSGAGWRNALKTAEETLSDYRTKFGAPPANMTMRELEVAAAEARVAELTARKGNILGDLLGGRPRSHSVS